MAWITPQSLKLLRSYLREMAIIALAWIYLREKMLRESEQKEYNEHLINDAKDFREDVYRVGAMSQKHCAEPAAFERANYMKMLDSYRPLN